MKESRREIESLSFIFVEIGKRDFDHDKVTDKIVSLASSIPLPVAVHIVTFKQAGAHLIRFGRLEDLSRALTNGSEQLPIVGGSEKIRKDIRSSIIMGIVESGLARLVQGVSGKKMEADEQLIKKICAIASRVKEFVDAPSQVELQYLVDGLNLDFSSVTGDEVCS